MTSIIPINHKRSSSNLDAQQYEPPIKKASFSSLPPSEIFEAPKNTSGSKKAFSRAPMGDFLAKCGLISRGQCFFEDIFINEDKNELAAYLPVACSNGRAPFSAASLDGICSGNNQSGEDKCISAYCLNETEQHSSSSKKQQQQQLLETRAREESSEFSMMCDEEDQSLKCNFLTEQLEPSAQIIIQGVESAQPLVRDFSEELVLGAKIENENRDDEFAECELQDGCFELKVIEFGNCN